MKTETPEPKNRHLSHNKDATSVKVDAIRTIKPVSTNKKWIFMKNKDCHECKTGRETATRTVTDLAET